MSEKLRSVNTRIWEDHFFEDLSPSEKLLFIYLLTNSATNLVGIYEISVKRMSFDTGLAKEAIQKALEGFQRVRKVLIIDNYIVLPNFLKHQSLNDNMKIGVIKLFKALPNSLKEKLFGNDYQTLQNDYPTLRNGLLKLNGIGIGIEVEEEEETKAESEDLKGLRGLFDLFRENYPGTKRGLDVEFENLKKKHKDWKDIVPILDYQLSCQKNAREDRRSIGGFVPEWKNLQTWINQRCWEEIMGITSDKNKNFSDGDPLDKQRKELADLREQKQ